MNVARTHTFIGLCHALLGMVLGIYMASSQNHGQHVTHAHILLLGFVVSLLYGMVYRLWTPDVSPRLATVQLVLHQVGVAVIVVGLFLLYGAFAPEATLGPILGIGSIAALLGAVLMLWIFVREGRAATATAGLATAQRS